MFKHFLSALYAVDSCIEIGKIKKWSLRLEKYLNIWIFHFTGGKQLRINFFFKQNQNIFEDCSEIEMGIL